MPALIEELRKQGMGHVLVVAGGIIPSQVRVFEVTPSEAMDGEGLR